MIDGEKVLGVIPARGQSKGVPRKNLRLLAGKPLIAWALDAANESRYLDRVVLSTDDEEIAQAFRREGGEAPFLRPSALAQDDTPGIAPLVHACEQLPGYDWVVLLQPTSPLRRGEDIDAGVEACVRGASSTAVTVVEEEHGLHVYYLRDEKGVIKPLVSGLRGVTRRQGAPVAYRVNGAVYVARVNHLLAGGRLIDEDTVSVLMPAERSVDIDTLADFSYSEWLLSQGGSERS